MTKEIFEQQRVTRKFYVLMCELLKVEAVKRLKETYGEEYDKGIDLELMLRELRKLTMDITHRDSCI